MPHRPPRSFVHTGAAWYSNSALPPGGPKDEIIIAVPNDGPEEEFLLAFHTGAPSPAPLEARLECHAESLKALANAHDLVTALGDITTARPRLSPKQVVATLLKLGFVDETERLPPD